MGLSEMDAQVYGAPGRRYGNEGNMTPSSHKPRPPSHMCRRWRRARFDSSRFLAQTSLWASFIARGGETSQAHQSRVADGWFGASTIAIAQKLNAAFNNRVDEHKSGANWL